MPVAGIPLIKKALESRCWNSDDNLSSSRLIFILRTCPQLPEFEKYLSENFPNALTVELSSMTKGALCSALAGASLITDFSAPIVIDLVDILYEANFSPQAIFNSQDILGILPWFTSDDAVFSYLEIENNRVIRTVEKKVISSHASAGTYFFKDLGTFLNCASQSIAQAEQVSVNGNLFVCPAFSFISPKVLPVEVTKAQPISKIFK